MIEETQFLCAIVQTSLNQMVDEYVKILEENACIPLEETDDRAVLKV